MDMITPSIRFRGLGWGSVALWILVTGLGWGSGLYPITPLTVEQLRSGSIGIFGCVVGAPFGALGAFIVAPGQWLILLSLGRQYTWWLWSTFIGMFVGWGVANSAAYPVASLLNLPSIDLRSWVLSAVIIGSLAGSVVGVLQWIALRRYGHSASWWILVSVIAWAIGGAVYWIAYRTVGGPFTQPWSYYQLETWPGDQVYYRALILGWVAGGVVVGSITGFALKLLLARSTSKAIKA